MRIHVNPLGCLLNHPMIGSQLRVTFNIEKRMLLYLLFMTASNLFPLALKIPGPSDEAIFTA